MMKKCKNRQTTVATGIAIVLWTIVVLSSRIIAEPIAENADKFLGNVSPSQSNGMPSNFSDYWNQITPENSGKWGMVERTRDNMSWGSVDMAYEYARDNGFLFKQHTFVWGRQEPSWIGSLSEDEQRAEVEEWIKAYGDRYPETDMIDVVNEPINTPASFREALGGAGETGWDWIIWTFEKAREYCPKAKLLINEFDVVNNGALLQTYLEIINLLKERDLIDAIGIQSHCFSVQNDWPDTIINHLNLLAETGLPLYSSELDLQGDDSLQLLLYKAYFPIFWEHPAIKGITLWGWQYQRTWIDLTYLLDRNDNDRPALTWLREYVSEHPTGAIAPAPEPRQTAGSAIPILSTDAHGGLYLHLYGEHTVTATLYDLQGRVEARSNGTLAAGNHQLQLRSACRTAGTRLAVVTIDGRTRLKMVLPALLHP
ncbi:MAG: endo-1,4-beta-xylanase [Chitinispirillaceae bacterium]|nr:endo-1,4-beta-xylanase [Chitinispirillaceae bacterium]